MKLSIVIPAYNESSHIGKLLASLADQVGSEAFEVVVVDNGSTDDTAAVARQSAGGLDLRVISEPRRGRGAARAAGFAAAKGEIILSTDADTAVPRNWIALRAKQLRENKTAVAITGTCHIEDCRPAINKRFNWLQPQMMRGYRLVFGHYWLTGSNFAIWREAYEQAGGFDPVSRDLDDIDLGFRVNKIGKIAMVTDAPVVTSGRRFQNGLIAGLLPYVSVFFRRFALRSRHASRD